MTNNLAELHVEILGDIQDCLTVFLQKQSSGTDVTQISPKQSGAWVRLPLRSSLLQSPGNKILSQVELKLQSLFFSPQEVHNIRTYTADNHLSEEAALIALINLSLQDHTHLRAITRIVQVRRKTAKARPVKIHIQLVGPMEWHEKLADNVMLSW